LKEVKRAGGETQQQQTGERKESKKEDSLNPRRSFKINDAHLFACQDFALLLVFFFSLYHGNTFYFWTPAATSIQHPMVGGGGK
jgi:hypothetical protein